jgi:hypothetical protein
MKTMSAIGACGHRFSRRALPVRLIIADTLAMSLRER